MTDPALPEEAATDAAQQAASSDDDAGQNEPLAQALRREQFYTFLKGEDGLNPMVNACSDLLATLMRIHAATEAELAELEALYYPINEQLVTLTTTLSQTGLYDEVMMSSCRYSLCVMLDEAVLKKPWMQRTEWAKQPLTQRHYNKKPTDDQLDAILTRLLINPTKYKAVIEVIYQGLLLGYEGINSYGVDEAGKGKRKTAIKDVQRFLSTYWSKPKQQLTEPYQYHIKKSYEIKTYYSPWIMVSVTLMVIGGMYWFFDYLLDADTQEVLRQLHQLSGEKG